MNYNQAKKIGNKDEVILKKSFNGTESVLTICGEPTKVKDPVKGNSVLLFSLFTSNGGLIKDVPHTYLK